MKQSVILPFYSYFIERGCFINSVLDYHPLALFDKAMRNAIFFPFSKGLSAFLHQDRFLTVIAFDPSFFRSLLGMVVKFYGFRVLS